MLSWLRRWRETAERIDAEADALIGELGVEAYAEALRREYESSVDAIALWWSRVALAIAHKTGERIGLDIASPLAMNTVFAPDREHAEDRKPQPFRQADESQGGADPKAISLQFISFASDRGPPIVTEVEIQASALRRRKRRAAEQMVEARRIFSGQCREAFEREQRQRLVDIGAVVLAWIRLKPNAAIAICGAVIGARGSGRSAGGLRRFGIGRDCITSRRRSRPDRADRTPALSAG